MTIQVFDDKGNFIVEHTGSKYAMKKKRIILEFLGYTVTIKPDPL